MSRRRRFLIVLGVMFVALNLVAFMHAWAMTHFRAGGGPRTRRPNLLGVMDKVRVLVTGISLPRPIDSRTPAALWLPYEPLRLTASDGTGLVAWRIPARQPRGSVLMCHGYAGCMSDSLEEAADFHRLGWDVWMLDMRGCGQSDGDATSIGFYEALDVAAAFRAMAASARGPCVIFGQSMGSAAALRAVATQGIRPHALLLENPFNTMLAAVQNRFGSFGLPSFPFAECMVFWGGCQQGFWGFGHNPQDYATRVDCPVLLMVGDEDTDATPAQVERIGQALRGSWRMERFPHAPHAPLRRADATHWLRAISGALLTTAGSPG